MDLDIQILQAHIILEVAIGIDALSSEELADCFDALCPCGEPHSPENLRKLRTRLTLFGTTACYPNRFVAVSPSTGILTPLSDIGDATVGLGSAP